MKKVMIILIILVASIAGYIWIAEPEALEGIIGKKKEEAPAAETHDPAPPKKSKPVSKPKTDNAPKAHFQAPNSDLAIYINGKPIQAGATETLEPGPLVVSGYGSDSYVHEVVQLKAGETASPQFKTRNTAGSASWSTFQGDASRTGFVKTRDRVQLQLKWSKDFGEKVQSSPIIIENTAYFSSEDHLLSAVDLETGDVKWSEGELGSSVSPIANSTHIFAGNDSGQFGGYRLEDGKRKGFQPLGTTPSSLALISEDAFLAATRSNQVFSIKTKKRFTGSLPLKVNWEVELPELGNATASPVVIDNRAIFQTEAGKLLAIDLESGKRIWPATGADTNEMDGNMVMSFVDDSTFLTPTPAAMDGVVYAVLDGALTAVQANSGKTIWQTPLKYKVSSSVSLANGMLYLGGADGHIYAHSTEDGVKAFSVRVSSKPLFASPVLFKDKILAATGEGSIKLINAFSGELVGESDALKGAGIDSTPAVSDQFIFAINRKGKMACFN